MDNGEGEGGLIRKTARNSCFPRFCILLALSVLLAAGAGCLWGRGAKGPPSSLPGDEEGHFTLIEPREEEDAAKAPAPSGPAPEFAGEGEGETEEPEAEEIAEGGREERETPPSPPGDVAAPAQVPAKPSPVLPGEEAAAAKSGGEEAKGSVAPKGDAKRVPGATAMAPRPGKQAAPGPAPDVPAWAERREVLIYRIEFLGLTMGYARFTFKGRVEMQGRDAYLLNVRAWTSDFLSVIYPINDSIDYYLDARTLAPLRLEFTRGGGKKDDIAIYDQVNGTIVYRFKDTGKIRKQVVAPPNTYDPVSAAYYFRTRDLGEVDRNLHMYGGRKLYQISTKLLRQESIDTSLGRVATVVVQPVIKREGQLENKGDLRMWMTNDSRRIPVRIYAKFRKIRDWTLQAELLPPKEGG
jgi:hypothetical protein